MTTKKRISRVFAVALAIVLTMAMAVPAFAATDGDYFFRANNGQGEYLNVWTPGATVAPTNYIRLYGFTGADSQKWRVYKASDGSYSFRTMANTSLAINKMTNGTRAILWSWADGRTDSDLGIATYDNETRYHCFLKSGGGYITAEGGAQGAYVGFVPYNGVASQWKRM